MIVLILAITLCMFCGLGFALGYVVGRKQHEG